MMVAGINKPFTQNPNSYFSRIENNSELYYMGKNYQSYRILPARTVSAMGLGAVSLTATDCPEC